ncbi:WYL domain-containing protein [Thermanaerosceptrum fracticalcis]|uniref:WYL domain-containing protein n=1 Tax=Thermanaerosceptrum fracticalcis TaxID=1712410 RepID=A0A7G6E085_THEFR|nr:WYL domain-containing protein [Thermanaerosceptrum fracticalcis]QNB45489.1 WYL domain-containing protein [Thermanaerosceptrum fracticalcis]
MSRLEREIRIYQGIVDQLKEGRIVETGELCTLLGINEKTLFTYLESADAALDVSRICHNGNLLCRETVRQYNTENRVRISKDMNKSARLAKLINILNQRTPAGGATLQELAEKLEVTERTVYRDLCELELELSVKIIRPDKIAGKKGRYRLENTYLPPVSPDKALFIYLSLLQQKGTPLAGRITEIKQALLTSLSKNRYSIRDISLNKLEERIHIVDQSLYEQERVGRCFLTILEGLDKGLTLKIKYFVAYRLETTERLVEPYGLICKHHNWYLIGKSLDKGELRNFRLDQVEEALLYREKPFVYPRDFSVSDYAHDSWGVIQDEEVVEAILRFTPEGGYRLKKVQYHPSQEILEEKPDGSVVVRFCLTGTVEFISWLLQWGNKVEVLAPSELREQVLKTVEGIVKVYNNTCI